MQIYALTYSHALNHTEQTNIEYDAKQRTFTFEGTWENPPKREKKDDNKRKLVKLPDFSRECLPLTDQMSESFDSYLTDCIKTNISFHKLVFKISIQSDRNPNHLHKKLKDAIKILATHTYSQWSYTRCKIENYIRSLKLKPHCTY